MQLLKQVPTSVSSVSQTIASSVAPFSLHTHQRGQTIIEKFERHSDVGFAVVLVTPDDIGAAEQDPVKTKKRARQNVILELGYFIGKLGRKRVCSLYVEGVELPSDIHDVFYIPYDRNGKWRSKLTKEIQGAGIRVDFTESKKS